MSCPLDAREPGECCGQDWHTGRWPAQTPSGDRTPGDVTKGLVDRDGGRSGSDTHAEVFGHYALPTEWNVSGAISTDGDYSDG